MTNDRFTRSGRKLTTRQIERLEAQLGCKLPPDYRRFMLEQNGGNPEKACFPVQWRHFLFYVDWFCTVDANLAERSAEADYKTLARAMHKYGDIVPRDALVIGRANRDDPLLLFIRGRRRGQVYVKYLHELPLETLEEMARHPHQGVRRVAKSFSEFLRLLSACPE